MSCWCSRWPPTSTGVGTCWPRCWCSAPWPGGCAGTSRTVSLPALLMITVAVQATGLLVFPLTSDDIYRYVWDGRVQLAGIDPYRFVPLDPALTFLRDAQLFPPGGPPAINRPGVHTIYPPGAQALFTAVAFARAAVARSRGTPGGGRFGRGDHHRAARPLPGSAAWARAALRRQPAGDDRGGQRRSPRRPGGAGRARCGLVHGQPATLVGRTVPRAWRPRSSSCPCCSCRSCCVGVGGGPV